MCVRIGGSASAAWGPHAPGTTSVLIPNVNYFNALAMRVNGRPKHPNATLGALAANYLAPWRTAGVSQEQVNAAHLHWADYRDAQWGGAVPLGTSRNRLLRVNILGGRLYYVSCVGQRSTARKVRQRAILALIRATLAVHELPDVDLVLSLSDRPTVPRHAVTDGSPPLVFGYVTTAWHWSVPFPYAAFEPQRWAPLYQQLGHHPALEVRKPQAVWRGSCNSLCDMLKGMRSGGSGGASGADQSGGTGAGGASGGRGGGCSIDLLDRLRLLRHAARCPELTDVALTKVHAHCRGFPARAPLTLREHAQFAYLIHVDGNGFSGRLEELLSLGGVVLKEESPFGGWYYPLLRAHEHVVPLARNLSTLCDSLSALREEPRRAAALAAAAQRFATAFLAPERVMGYVAALVRGYATLQRFRPRRHPMAKEWADAETVVSRPTAAATTDATVPSASSGRASGFPSSVAFCPPADVSCCKRHPRACRRRRGTR